MTYKSKEKLKSVSELAEHFNVHKMTIYRWFKQGDLRGVKLGNTLRFRTEDIETFVNRVERKTVEVQR